MALSLVQDKDTTSNYNEEGQQYNTKRFIDVGGGGDILYIPVIDVHARNFKTTETQFKKFGNRKKSDCGEVAPTSEALVDHYFNEDFMFTMVNSSNVYACERKR